MSALDKPKQLYRSVMGEDSALEKKVSSFRMQRRQRRKEIEAEMAAVKEPS